ncbi:MAG: hypothetical protein P1U53_08775 [Sulfitobacter sp.]|nr:hypothetical protein [Sulfitobacter sp.]
MFEWDEAKRRLNRLKHSVDFLDAALIFAGPVLIKEDRRIDYGEQRLSPWDGQMGRYTLSPTRCATMIFV